MNTPYLDLVVAPTFNMPTLFNWANDFTHVKPGGSCDAVVIRNLLNNNTVYQHVSITFAIKCDVSIYNELVNFQNLVITRHHQQIDYPNYYLLVTGSVTNWIKNIVDTIINDKTSLALRLAMDKIFLAVEKSLPEAVAHLHKVGQDDGTFLLRIKGAG